MDASNRQGLFEVIDSFVIRRRKEFYFIGTLKEGTVQENWHLLIPFNKSLSICNQINGIEEVEIANDKNKYTLLITTCEDDTDMDLLLSLSAGSEVLEITIEGAD